MKGLTSAVLAVVLIGIAGCHAAPPPTTIVIDKMAFGPAPSGLKVGQTVIWDNHDILQHTATAVGGGFDVDLKPHTQGSSTLTKAGRITVRCRYHPGMTVTLDVAP